MRSQTRRSAIAVGAVAAAALVGIGGIALSPAQAQQVAATIDRVLAVVNCNSFNACDGGINANAGFGVLASSAKNNGVDAATKNPSVTHAGRSGVYGHDDSTDGGKQNVGVAGYSPNGTGMQGSSINGTGVWGQTTKGSALLGTESSGDTYAALQLVSGTFDSNGNAIVAYNSKFTPVFEVNNQGDEFINGLLFTHGGCQSGCSPTHHVTEYAPRESEPTMEDIGEGRLVAGKAYVLLDPAYANVISRGASYVVFVSPEGPNQGLYVATKTDRGFEVMENPGGHSTIPFGYRIVAKPYGVTAARLPRFVDQYLQTTVRPPAGEASIPRLSQ